MSVKVTRPNSTLLGCVAAALVAAPVALSAAPGAKPAKAAKPVKPAAPGTAPAPAGNPTEFFTREVLPVLKEKCASCHSGEQPMGGLKLTSRADLLKGGAGGPAAIAGKPAESLLIKAINYQGRRMPPQGKMAPAQIAVLTKWVELGMPWPEGEHGSLEPKHGHAPPQVNAETKRFWSFQPVRRPAIPAVKARAWVRSPIDAFVLAGLEKAGLTPNPPADKATLIRRAYYDLIGLPPTPEEVDQFVKDGSPDAWPRLIDRLLASPQYGEKWGRHWLDLVRYAETNSYERDGAKPFAWRYRDYVIQSFNQDKPYDQFLTEQLAGDELPGRTPEKLIATGYYRMGLWDDEPADPKQALYDDLDDITNTTGQVFLGLSVGCARCHDHKLDPFPQKDYYRMLAFFNGVNRYGIRGDDTVERWSLRSIASEEEAKQFSAATAAWESQMREKQAAIEPVERKIFPDLAPVEKEEWRTDFYRPRMVRKRVGKLLTQEEFDAYTRAVDERRRLRENRPNSLAKALCVTEVGAKPRDTFVLLRGNPHAEGDPVTPGFPTVLGTPDPQVVPPAGGESSGRRLALAQWIASKENPLTARVMANRVWQFHFGRGIVRSTSNFGFQGDKPTHPELLDWLAANFVDGVSSPGSKVPGQASPNAGLKPWSLKSLHRTIMLSNTYQMSSRANPVALKKDAENNLLWRFDMRRLQAEEIRDSILAVNGSLNPKMGGPSIYPTIPAEVLAGQSMPGAGWGRSTPEEQRRRSVYIFQKRSLPVPIIAAFDGPETDFTCAARFATTQPTQALGMLNSAWTNEQASLFAAYLKKNAGEQTGDQVRLALRRVLQRSPSTAEVTRGVKLIESLQKEDGLNADAALASFCAVALNLNEFIYLD